jgi:hypothetical protein
MIESERESFEQLKNAIQQKVEEKLGIRKAITDWSLNDIRDFQADLESECKSTVSEKWIYTHFKNEGKKLPRIDVLNLLSNYCGYKNWDDFTFQFTEQPRALTPKKNSNWLMIVVVLAAPVLGLLWFVKLSQKTVVVFKDAYTQHEVAYSSLSVISRSGDLKLTSKQIWKGKNADTLLVDGAYYKPKEVYMPAEIDQDTLVVELLPDDYALMLNYFSRSSAQDWQKRANQLREAIHEEAKIFQSHPTYKGIELLNREEFIDRLILPINSLKNLEILDIVYKDNKIYRLRFVQQKE